MFIFHLFLDSHFYFSSESNLRTIIEMRPVGFEPFDKVGPVNIDLSKIH